MRFSKDDRPCTKSMLMHPSIFYECRYIFAK